MGGLRLIAAAAALIVSTMPHPAAAGDLYAHGDMTLRRGPGDNFSVLSTVSAGSKVSVLWCNADGDWCLIDDGLLQGWAPIGDIKARGDGTGGVDPAEAARAIEAGGTDAETGPGISGGLTTPGGAVSLPSTSVSVATPAAGVSTKVQ